MIDCQRKYLHPSTDKLLHLWFAQGFEGFEIDGDNVISRGELCLNFRPKVVEILIGDERRHVDGESHLMTMVAGWHGSHVDRVVH